MRHAGERVSGLYLRVCPACPAWSWGVESASPSPPFHLAVVVLPLFSSLPVTITIRRRVLHGRGPEGRRHRGVRQRGREYHSHSKQPLFLLPLSHPTPPNHTPPTPNRRCTGRCGSWTAPTSRTSSTPARSACACPRTRASSPPPRTVRAAACCVLRAASLLCLSACLFATNQSTATPTPPNRRPLPLPLALPAPAPQPEPQPQPQPVPAPARRPQPQPQPQPQPVGLLAQVPLPLPPRRRRQVAEPLAGQAARRRQQGRDGGGRGLRVAR